MTDMKDLVLGVTIFGGDVEPTVFRDSKYDMSLVKYPGSVFVLGCSQWQSLRALLFGHSNCLDLDKLAVG